MHGRYYRKADKQKIVEAFHAEFVDDGTPNPPWDQTVAPTTIQPVIATGTTPTNALSSIPWDLIPFFTKNLKDAKGISTIKARAQTVSASHTYREPFKKRRCLVPADDFYEWKRLDLKNKQPFAFDLLDGSMMAFAGLWDAWKDPSNGIWLHRYTIITIEASELMAPVHNRMPVILHPRNLARWLDRDSDPERPPIDLLRSFPADEMEAFEVSNDVGNLKNNSPELLNSK